MEAKQMSPAGTPERVAMRRVTGIGGIFIKVKDPKAMYAWYEKHLGMKKESAFQAVPFKWKEEETGHEGMTMWSLFEQASKYFDPSHSTVMINYRVADMDALLKAFESEGIKVLGRQDEQYGRFAWIMDPEGNKIELWEAPKSGS
jgi:predicted enzyme related to lactoylglutathione lyase